MRATWATLVSKVGWAPAGGSGGSGPSAGCVPMVTAFSPDASACGAGFGARPAVRRAAIGSGFPDDLFEETGGARGCQCLRGQAVHDLHIVIHVVAPFQVKGAGELLDIGHVGQVGLAEPQHRE